VKNPVVVQCLFPGTNYEKNAKNLITRSKLKLTGTQIAFAFQTGRQMQSVRIQILMDLIS